MKAQNPDIYGFIRIEDTNISYPFVLGEDNEFYLVHDAVQCGYLDSGAIFADYRCSKRGVEYNRNTVLYGHNMTRGTMFAELIKYNDEEFFRTHDIYVYTETGLYVYRPFSFFRTNERHQYFRVIFLSDEDYLGFMTEMQGLSMFETDIELTAADRMLTLSTCTNVTSSGRYCLQAKLIRIEQ
jgi:sortase B